MASYNIEKILDKRTRKGLIEYLIQWEGYDSSENTWELRKDLIRDGCGVAIKEYEKRLNNKGDVVETSVVSVTMAAPSQEKTPKAARGRTPRRSKVEKSPGRTPRSPSPKAATPAKARRSVSRGRQSAIAAEPMVTPKAAKRAPTPKKRRSTSRPPPPPPAVEEEKPPSPRTSPRVSAKVDAESALTLKPVTRRRSEKEEEEADEKSPAEEMESEEKQPQEEEQEGEVGKEGHPVWEWDVLADRFGAFLQSKKRMEVWLLFGVTVSSMIAYFISHNLAFFIGEDGRRMDTHLAVAILTRTTSIPPLALLVLLLTTRNGRYFFCKWLSVVFVWRTAGEVILLLPEYRSSPGLFHNAAVLAFGLSYIGVVVSIAWLVAAEKNRADALMRVFAAFGATLLVISDITLFLVKQSSSQQQARFLLMSLSLMVLTIAGLQERAPKKKKA